MFLSHKFFSAHFAIDYPYIDIFSSRGRKSLLNCMCCMLKMYSCGTLFCLLACSRVNVPWVLTCSRTSASCVLTYLRALPAYRSTCSVCLRAQVPTRLACSRINMSCVFTCTRALRAHVLLFRHFLSPLPHIAVWSRDHLTTRVTCLVSIFDATSFTYTIGEFLQFN